MHLKTILLLVALLSGASARSLLEAETCRVETECIGQPCSPTSYQYDLSTAGLDFPFTVTYTKTADASSTSFVFLVCSNAVSLGGCKRRSPNCVGLSSFQLRLRNDILENGATVVASPAGLSWASCYPNGPGYKWEAEGLGALATTIPAENDTCSSFTITIGAEDPSSPATLADICQQNITLIETGDSSTVANTGNFTTSCLYTLSLANGRSAYGILGKPTPQSRIVADVADAPVEDVTTYSATLAVENEQTASVTEEESASVTSSGTPTPYGPTPYGPARRRLSAVQARHVRRLF